MWKGRSTRLQHENIRKNRRRSVAATAIQSMWRRYTQVEKYKMQIEEKKERKAVSTLERALIRYSLANKKVAAQDYAYLSYYARRIQSFFWRISSLFEPSVATKRNRIIAQLQAQSATASSLSLRDSSASHREAKKERVSKGGVSFDSPFQPTPPPRSERGGGRRHQTIVMWSAKMGDVPNPARITESSPSAQAKPEPTPPPGGPPERTSSRPVPPFSSNLRTSSPSRVNVSKARAQMRLLAALRSGRRDLLRDAIAVASKIPELQAEVERASILLSRLSQDYLRDWAGEDQSAASSAGSRGAFKLSSIRRGSDETSLSPREMHRLSHNAAFSRPAPALDYRQVSSDSSLPYISSPTSSASMRPLSASKVSRHACNHGDSSPLSPSTLHRLSQRYVKVDSLDMSAEVSRVHKRIEHMSPTKAKVEESLPSLSSPLPRPSVLASSRLF
mmetsp:Transcript_5833/g.13794  ORF Transcript_5833/g.13794 Transcript_5833/m.13794 type:complete len:447 (-) Transcript_5833:1474-2814(-)